MLVRVFDIALLPLNKKMPQPCLLSICSCHVPGFVRVLVTLQQMNAGSLLMKHLCKYSSSLNIEQQRAPFLLSNNAAFSSLFFL